MKTLESFTFMPFFLKFSPMHYEFEVGLVSVGDYPWHLLGCFISTELGSIHLLYKEYILYDSRGWFKGEEDDY